MSVTDSAPPAGMLPLVWLIVKTRSPALIALQVNAAVPLLLIVSPVVDVCPTVTLPNARLPDSPITRVTTGAPIPDTAMALVPLLASLVTVMVPV